MCNQFLHITGVNNSATMSNICVISCCLRSFDTVILCSNIAPRRKPSKMHYSSTRKRRNLMFFFRLWKVLETDVEVSARILIVVLLHRSIYYVVPLQWCHWIDQAACPPVCLSVQFQPISPGTEDGRDSKFGGNVLGATWRPRFRAERSVLDVTRVRWIFELAV